MKASCFCHCVSKANWRELVEKDGKFNDYNGVFAFSVLLKNTTKDTAGDKPHYLVMLAKKRQLPLRRSDVERGFCRRGASGLRVSRGPVKWWLKSTGRPPFFCSNVAWSYQAVNTKTNYRGGNFTAKEDLSSTKAFSLFFLSLCIFCLLVT